MATTQSVPQLKPTLDEALSSFYRHLAEARVLAEQNHGYKA